MGTFDISLAAAKESFITRYAINSNLLESAKFVFLSQNMKYLNLFATGAIVPSVSLGEVLQPTPLVDIYRAGDKIQYEPITATFLIDEDLRVYEELYNWMKGLGFPHDHSEYSNQVREGRYADLNVLFLKNSTESNLKMKLYNAFPIFLGPIQMSSQESPDQVLTTDVTFRYDTFEMSRENT